MPNVSYFYVIIASYFYSMYLFINFFFYYV